MDRHTSQVTQQRPRTPSRRAFLRRTAAGATLALAASQVGRHGAAAQASQAARAEGVGSVARTADALLSDLVTRRLFRGSVLIARRGRVILSKGYDWADVAHHTPNTPRTRFRIASITKQFTAMAILQLQEQGKLHVHDRLSAYLSPCPVAWQAITLHQLLTHSSGIPDYTTLPTFPTVMTRPLTPRQLIALFSDRPLDFRPGTRWRYSNSGYVLLGAIVERVSGVSYAGFLHRHICAPLHLNATGASMAPPRSGRVDATGYTSWQRPAAYDRSGFADGGLSSTVEDLYRWDQAVTTGRPALVSPSTLRAMFTPSMPTEPAAGPHGVAYGYGWFIGSEGTHREIEHTGEISGFLSSNQLYPDDGLTIIVLSNLESNDGLRQITSHLAGIVFTYADCQDITAPCTEL